MKPSDWLMDHFRKPTPDAAESDLPTAQLRALVQLVTKRDDNGHRRLEIRSGRTDSGSRSVSGESVLHLPHVERRRRQAGSGAQRRANAP